MMKRERGAKRTAKPNIFLSHSSKDKDAAVNLAKTLNFCCLDVWLDDWELEVGDSLVDEISKAMDDSRYIGILITENYNKSVWTKREYKKALSREQKEERTVMLPIVIGKAEVPDFLEDKLYIDLRNSFYNNVLSLVGMIHGISRFRISEATSESELHSVLDIWNALESIGFEPYVVLGGDDFKEMLKHGGELVKEDYATFDPTSLIMNDRVSEHVKSLVNDLFG